MDRIKYAFEIFALVVYAPVAIVILLLCFAIKNMPSVFYMLSTQWEERRWKNFIFAVVLISCALYFAYYVFDKALYFLADILYDCGYLTAEGAIFIAGFSIVFILVALIPTMYKSICEEKDGE